MHVYEQWVIRRYLANALRASRFGEPPPADSDIVAWIESSARSLGLPALTRTGSRRSSWTLDPSPVAKARWRAWRSDAIKAARWREPRPSPLQRRIDWLANACSLDAPRRWMLGLIARATVAPKVRSLVAAVNDRYGCDFNNSGNPELRHFCERGFAGDELSSDGRLAQLGLVDARDELRLSGVARRVLALKRLSARNVSDLLLGEPAPASLGWEDFAHLGDRRDLAARIIGTAGRARGPRRTGANVLFYGPPGTGKSQFARTLGAHLGFSVQFCGETNEQNGEPNRRERIAALMIANAIGGAARKTIVVVDEADDLFAGVDEDDFTMRRGSKVFMNRLVERAAAPKIWITNEIERLGQPIVRRMTFVLRFPRPSLPARKSIVARIAKGAGLRLDQDSAAELAHSPAPLARIENAIRSAADIRGSGSDARKILESGLRAVGLRDASTAPAPIGFDPNLSSADVDLAKLADQIARSRTSALSFCLSGPPGTGKSAYARYLAERLDLEVLERRFSDLGSMDLGESEKAIARAFEEAGDLRAFLILDEADSLLRDRGAAHHSWEVTQVNEMLTQMERHPHPFASTTNAPELLDAAAARRFLFKVRFLPMTAPQIAEAYRRAFGFEAPAFVLKLSGLTPADFATVARKASALDARDPRRLMQWLEHQALAKPDAGRRRIGF